VSGAADPQPRNSGSIMSPAKMRESRKDPLREFLDRELVALTSEATSTNAAPSTERIETLNNLNRLIELRDCLGKKRRVWILPLVLVATLIIASALLFARVDETDVELELSLSGLSFTLARDQVFTGATELTELGVSGIRNVELPDPLGRPIETDESPESLSLEAGTAGPRKGTVTLAPVVVPTGTRLTLQCADIARKYRLSTNAGGLSLRASIDGPVEVRPSGSATLKFDLAAPRAVFIEGDGDGLDLDLTFAAVPRSSFSSQLDVSEIAFSGIDQFLDLDRTVVRRISTILAGKLYFESLNGAERQMRPGEDLQFRRSRGELRTVELADHSISVRFRGHVSGMTSGTGEGRRSLMPTYLEWLQARHGLALLWGTSVYFFGLIAAALGWWGVRT
jgi:hypothetical protein